MMDIQMARGTKKGEKEREGKREKEGRLYNEGRMWEMEEEEGVKNEKDGDKPLASNIFTVAPPSPLDRVFSSLTHFRLSVLVHMWLSKSEPHLEQTQSNWSLEPSSH